MSVRTQHFTGIGVIRDGIWMLGRFSVGWNLHRSRQIKTVVIGLAVALVADRVVVMIGPVTFLWLLEQEAP